MFSGEQDVSNWLPRHSTLAPVAPRRRTGAQMLSYCRYGGAQGLQSEVRTSRRATSLVLKSASIKISGRHVGASQCAPDGVSTSAEESIDSNARRHTRCASVIVYPGLTIPLRST